MLLAHVLTSIRILSAIDPFEVLMILVPR